MRTTAARPADQHRSNKRSSVPNARRMRIPAFGEWNHHGDDGGNGNGIGNGTWPAVMTPFFDLATLQKAAPKTGRRRRGGDDGFDAAKLATAAEAPQGHMQTRRSKVGHMQTRRSEVANSGAYAAAAARRTCFTVAKPVDDDLYGVPPDMMLYGKPAPRKEGWLRILRLLGCSCCLSPS
ncbi:uncharacterized protein [Miscanthus floridulus]|uniref:uncharacterized protein n=1 Tax=Miscanthus floridulus TaxID=154761 RepID=UPI00345794B6